VSKTTVGRQVPKNTSVPWVVVHQTETENSREGRETSLVNYKFSNDK